MSKQQLQTQQNSQKAAPVQSAVRRWRPRYEAEEAAAFTHRLALITWMSAGMMMTTSGAQVHAIIHKMRAPDGSGPRS